MSRTDFTTIRTEGALLPPGLLKRLREPKNGLPGTDDAEYHVAPPRRLSEVISEAWNTLQGTWTAYRTARDRLPDSETGTTLTREGWLQPLFQALGYGRLLTRTATTVDGVTFPISHGWHHVPIHLVSHRVDLDRRTAGVAGAARTSPHGLIQSYLNATDDSLWGIVSNGHRLRLLRDHHALTRPSYVEYDLEAMFDGEVYSDFVLLFLTLHQSRLEAAAPTDTLLEQWATLAREQGTRALDRLRDGVERALKALGQGFLDHPGNGALRERLRTGDLDAQDYYRQLLRIVYRLLVLFAAEDRDLLHPPDTSDAARERYQHYGTRRLREIADRVRGGPHHDRYETLKRLTRWLAHDGAPAIGVPALGGSLYDPNATPDLDATHLANRAFLAAIRALAFTNDDGAHLPVDYRNLGAEELGSVYESLLELHPVFEHDRFTLTTAAGNERKTTGSYYTPTSLITLLLDSALDPVLDDAARAPDPEHAILNLKIVDPSSGSGHFLIAAAHRVARCLAQVRTGDDEPAIDATRTALRDVIGHCLYAVDLNPMAIELCKVALWLEALEPGKPLTFLDHHIKRGNSVLGAPPTVSVDDTLKAGLPDTAFARIAGDDKDAAASLRDRNRKERGGERRLFSSTVPDVVGDLATTVRMLDELADSDIAATRAKEAAYSQLMAGPRFTTTRAVFDGWTSAFVWPKTDGLPECVTSGDLPSLHNGQGLAPTRAAFLGHLRDHFGVFHWRIEFPEVFDRQRPGFDVVLGNPPWDSLSPDQREYFGRFTPGLRSMAPEVQQGVIQDLLQSPEIKRGWEQYAGDLLRLVHFLKASGRFVLYAPGNLGKGDFNLFRPFAEVALDICRDGGRVAQVMPGGLYGGANASAIRKHLLDACQLTNVWGLINTQRGWFADVDMDRFCAYAAQRGGSTTAFQAAFGLTGPEQLPPETFTVLADLIRRLAPETYAIPDMRSPYDLAIVAKMYDRHPPFGDPDAGPPIRHYLREVDMGNDRGLFTSDEDGLPVYEGRMIDHYDHRAKVYVSGHGNSSVWDAVDFGDARKRIAPQWRVPARDVPRKLDGREKRYRIGFGDIANPRNVRSLVATLVPPGVVCGHTVPTIVFDVEHEWAYLPWLAVANSFTMDALARKKLSSPHMTMSTLDSLPFPRPRIGDAWVQRVAPLALRLTCTGPEMTRYWNSMSRYGWCEPTPESHVPARALLADDQRAEARAIIDATVAHDVFGLNHDELEDVLDSFPVLKRREEKELGHFRTKELILGVYRDIRECASAGTPYVPTIR